MKTYLKLVFIVILSMDLNGCKKEPNNPFKDITGQWNWLKTYSVAPFSETNPLTPQNTGITEIIVFNNFLWYKTINGNITDSGRYSLGHGVYTPYQGAHIYTFDSIAYFRNGRKLEVGDYFDIYNDTLQFSPGYGGQFRSYSLPLNGSKIWVRIK